MRFGLMVFAGLALAGCNDPAPNITAPVKPAANAVKLNTLDRSHAGTPAPVIPFEFNGGKKRSLADFRGQKILVNLWATWCAPCLAEMPQLDKLATARGKALSVLPISQDMEGWQVVDKFFAANSFATLKPYLDQPGSFAESLKARGLPISILYDEQGKEIWRVAGTPDWNDLATKGLI